MKGIASGLKALHAAGVIRRELTPDFVLLNERDDRPILTDLELAKLIEGGPTVAHYAVNRTEEKSKISLDATSAFALSADC